VLVRALTFYEPKQSLHAARVPGFHFVYLGQPYLYHPLTSDLAEEAIYLRADRLVGVPSPFLYHPCLWCGGERDLNGLHLLRCHHLPRNLAKERDQLIQSAIGQGVPAHKAIRELTTCYAPTKREARPDDPRAALTRKTLIFFRKLRRAVASTLSESSTDQPDVESSLAVLFGDNDPALGDLQEAVDNDHN
jgi:hypothetical protein